MLDLFRPQKLKAECEAKWKPLMEQAQTRMPENLPALKKRHAKHFITLWNELFRHADHDQRIGLAVFAYRVEIHRYAAGMLIHGRPQTRVEGIRILGNMGDETAWSLLSKLAEHNHSDTAQAARAALLQINEGRARREFAHYFQ